MQQVLDRLGIAKVNPGASDGEWIETAGEQLVSYSPIDGQEIARVRLADAAAYERVVSRSVEVFEQWRMIAGAQARPHRARDRRRAAPA